MRRSRALAGLLVVAALIVTVGIFGVEEGGEPSLGEKDTEATLPWSDLGIGALVGGLTGAVGTHLLRERAAGQRERREKAGLLRLLVTEMRHNQLVLYRTYDDLSAVGETAAAQEAMAQTKLFQFAAWEDMGVRLAQLLPSEAFTPLSSHYGRLQHIVDSVQRTNRMLGPPGQIVLRSIERAEISRMRAREVLERYLGSEAQDTMRGQWIGPEDTREEGDGRIHPSA